MAEDKRTFLQGKMNQDLDDRVLPNGEYRSAQNIQITTSEVSDIGSIQNLLGNSKIGETVSGFEGLDTIGVFFDEKNNRIYYFVTNYFCLDTDKEGLIGDADGPTTAQKADNNNLFCGIYMYAVGSTQPQLLVSGLFLNFSKTHTITGVNLIEDLLFFTDGFNQPRKINVEKAIQNDANSNNPYYYNEDKISVAKFAPFMPALLLDYDQTTLNGNTPTTDPVSSLQTNTSYPDDLIDEKFVRFSYRYRFVDGEYSTIAPFTQVCFIPKTHSFNGNHIQKILKRGEAYFQDDNGNSDGMVNSVNSVNLNIILPSSKLKTNLDINGIEILYKESNSNVIKAVELIEIKNENALDLVTPSNSNDFVQNEGVFQYKYKSTLPYKTLPADQLPRVYDNVPLSAKAQEIVGNRIIYGNFIQDRKLPIEKGVVGLNFNTSVDAKYDITNSLGNADFNNYYLHKEYPYHSIKQKRTYEVGVVLSDKFGRQSPVLTSVIGDGSVTVDAKSNTFNSSTWSENNLISIQDTSPGNENYCGDALTITFNKTIPNAYAKGTLININNTISTNSYDFDLFEGVFWTDTLIAGGPQGGSGLQKTLYYYSQDSNGLVFEAQSFMFEDEALTIPLTGFTAVYISTGYADASNFSAIKINLNSSTGEILSQETITISAFQSDVINITAPTTLISSAGDNNSIILYQTNITTSVVNDSNGNFLLGQIVIENASIISEFTVGDYLKGQTVDFVQITNIFIENGNLILQCDGEPSLSYNAVSGSVPLGYYFYKYQIIPHGWYSYRVVVKQTEQDYNNVYAPNVYDFDNDRDDPKTYIPILADNINKVTRDIEFTNTQETGLSTSKDKLFPKVVPSATNAGLSVQTNNDILDVINIGTAKEQGIKNENDDVFAFISETSKNPLMAQIPFGGSTGSNIGSNTELGLQGTLRTITVGSSHATEFKQANKVLFIKNGDTSEFAIGEYLKGSNKDLVKITKVSTSGSDVLVECDGSLSDEYKDLTNGESFRVYAYKYGVQDNLAVFETKPFDSALDIYYETSTAGLVHELNEALAIPSIIDKIEIEPNLSEDILYWDEGNFQGTYAGIINFLDVLDNNITSQDIIEVSINSIRSFVETTSPINDLATQALIAQESIITDEASMPFEIVLVDDEWRIKPKNNFYHSVIDGQQFNAYEFEVNVTHQQTSTQVVNLNNQVFTLRLENVAPIVQPVINIDGSVRSSQETENVVVGQVTAVNGSADVENNKKGLIFLSTGIENPSIASASTVISDLETNTTVTVDTNTVLHNANGDPIKELSINPNNGEISIRTEFFYGVVNKTFDVFVYDSDVLFLDSSEYVGDETGIFFGKRTLTTVNVQVTADLIVIEGALNDSDASHPYYSVTNTDQINQQDIFNQDLFFGEDIDLYNCYWTENPSSLEAFNSDGISQQSMPSAPRHSESGEYFICSFLNGKGNSQDPAQLWSIKIDESGEPRVRKYEKQSDRNESSTSDFLYYDHILPTSYRGEVAEATAVVLSETASDSELGALNPITVTMGGVIIIQEKGDNLAAYDVQRNIDLLGFGGTGISHDNGLLPNGAGTETLGDNPNGIEHDIRDKLAQGITQWDFEVESEGPFSSSNSGTSGDGGFNFDFNPITGETQGSYKYYTPSNVLSGSFAHPKDRGISDTFMFQTNNDIEILGYTYKIVYEMQRIYISGNYARDDQFWVPHVFLARKGND